MNLPKFLGIDVGRVTTKVTQVEWNNNKPKIVKAFNFSTGEGSLANDDANLRADLAKRINEAIQASKVSTRKCVVALPEPAVFNRLLTFPELDEKALNEAIHWNAKQFIPIPIDEVNIDYIKTADLQVNGKKMIQILLVAAPKKIVETTREVFLDAGMELIAIETESVATARVIGNNYPGVGAVMVLDIGSSGTDISVLNNDKLIFSQSLGTGSDAMTKAISGTFGLDNLQAEQYKAKFGMIPDQAEGKIFKAMQPVVSIITSEVIKTINFFKNKYQQSAPQKVFVIGEGAKTPGLIEYLAIQLGLPAEQANLLNGMEIDPELAKEFGDPKKDLTVYGVSLGLSLKTA